MNLVMRNLVLVCLLVFSTTFKIKRTILYNTNIINVYMTNEDYRFAGIKFSHPISSGLSALGVKEPTPIQKSSVGPLTAGVSAILHAETGSGKTLAYLLPLLKRLYHSPSEERLPMQALIIVPTKELAVQIGADIMRLTDESDSHPLVHICISSPKLGFDKIIAPIVVGTPFKINDCIKSSSIDPLSNLQYVVLDEVDRLISTVGKYASNDEVRASKNEESPTKDLMEKIVNARNKYKSEIQIVAASATVGRPLRRALYSLCSFGKLSGGSNEQFGNFPVILPADEVRTVGGIRRDESSSVLVSQRAIGIPVAISHSAYLREDTDDKGGLTGRLGLAKEVWAKSVVRRGLLFVPKVEDVRQVLGVLHFWGLAEAMSLQQQLGIETEKQVAVDRRSYTTASSMPPKRSTTTDLVHQAALNRIGSAGLATVSQNSSDSRELFVVPFTGSRGLHVQDVDLVLVLCPPKTMDEYVHLAGRTGRAGRPGQVISFVNLDELKRLQSWQSPLGVVFDIKM